MTHTVVTIGDTQFSLHDTHHYKTDEGGWTRQNDAYMSILL